MALKLFKKFNQKERKNCLPASSTTTATTIIKDQKKKT
jgi:hypothetical protein